MDYVKHLRTLVGHSPVILVAGVILVWKDDKLLFQHRRDTRNWGLPGGYMELGETPEACARRELLEETGLRADSLRLIGVYGGPNYYMKYPNDDEVYGINVVYRTDDAEGELLMDAEGLDLRYFSIRELPESVVPPHRHLLQELGLIEDV